MAEPSPMNATTHHAKVKLSLTLGEPYFIAGGYITGKMEMDCSADENQKGGKNGMLGIGIMMVELFAMQELTSRDHSARQTFIHTKRLFQGPGLPPSNAVHPDSYSLPPDYYVARRGHSTFLFRLPLPITSPSSIDFGGGLAKVKYQIRASVGVYWKGEQKVVIDSKEADVVEAFNDHDDEQGEPEATVVGENGKIWCQARVVGGILVAGESACVELQVKNHSAKKNSSLQISLLRSLHLQHVEEDHDRPVFEIKDTVTSVPFKGPEYVIPPGVEGVASLVFDVPKKTRGVRGGTLIGDEAEAIGRGRAKGKGPKMSQGIFEIGCVVEVKLLMGLGSKDIILEIPVTVVHPAALPELPPPGDYPYPGPYYDSHAVDPALAQAQVPYLIDGQPQPLPHGPIPYAVPVSPGPYVVDPTQNVVWFPPTTGQQYYNYNYNYDYPYAGVQSPPLPPHLSYPYPQTQTQTQTPTPQAVIASDLGYAYPQMQYADPLLPSMAYGPVDEAFVTHPGSGSGAAVATPRALLSPPLPLPPPLSSVPGVPLSSSASAAAVSESASLDANSNPVMGGTTNTRPHLTLGLGSLDQTSEKKLPTPLHSPRPILSPKRSFTSLNGSGENTLKSERVEELERLADEVGQSSRDLSGDGGIPEGRGGGDYFGVGLVVPTGADRSRSRSGSRERSRSKTPPTPATPTLLAVAKPSKVNASASAKANGHPLKAGMRYDKGLLQPNAGGGGGNESGLDALERKLAAQVGTKKVVDDKRPDVWSVLGGGGEDPAATTPQPAFLSFPSSSSGVGHQLGASANGNENGNGNGRRLSSTAVTRSSSSPLVASSPTHPIAIPHLRRDSTANSDLNDSAISSLTLPDPGHDVAHGHDSSPWRTELDEKLGRGLGVDLNREWGFDGEREEEKERERDSDEKTHKGALGSGGNKKNGKRKSSRGTLKEEEGVASDKAGDEKLKDKDRSKRKVKDRSNRSAASNGRVAAWLGGVEAEEAEPPLDDVIKSTSPSPRIGTENGGLPAEDTKPGKPAQISAESVPAPAPVPVTAPPPPPPPASAASPDPRSSGFVPIGTLKRDIYQRTLVPKDSPMASTSPTEDARRVADIWSHNLRERDAVKTNNGQQRKAGDSSPGMGSDMTVKQKNPWQSVVGRGSRLGTGIGKLPVFPSPFATPDPKTRSDPEVKYDVRSARGGKGGKVTAVKAIWASGAVFGSGGGATGSSSHSGSGGEESKSKASPRSPLSSSKSPVVVEKDKPGPGPKVPNKISSSASPFSAPRFPLRVSASASSSTSSTSDNGVGINGRARGMAIAPTRARPNLGGAGVKVSSIPSPVPAVISSSHARPMLSSTASLARPKSGLGSGATNGGAVGVKKISKVPMTSMISELELPSSKEEEEDKVAVARKPGTSLGLGSGKAANNLRAVTGSGSGSKGGGGGAGSSTSTSTAEHMAFGQARLRDLIKKYQGQNTS